MTDFQRVRDNLKKMVEGNATDREFEEYLSYEGVTAEQVKNYKEPGTLSQAGSWLHNTFVGTQDPRYKDVPNFANVDTLENSPDSSIWAKVVGQTDAQYGDIIEKNLRDQGRFIRREMDDNGFQVVTFKNDNGEEQQAYVNKPGWDTQDLKRGALAAAPYAATGGTVGLAARGALTATKIGGQFIAGLITSVASDVDAERMGSKQGIDPVKAVTAGAMAGAFEGISPIIAKQLSNLFSRNKFVGKDGNLTAPAREQLVKLGIDPDQIPKESLRDLKATLDKAATPEELAAKMRTDEFDIPTTKGQRLKSNDILAEEQAMRLSTYGPDAENVMKNFDKQQAGAIKEAALGQIGGQLDGSGAPIDPNLQGLGGQIRTGMQSAQSAAKNTERKLWSDLQQIYPEPEAKTALGRTLSDKLEQTGALVDKEITPLGHRALTDIETYLSGKGFSQSFSFMKQGAEEATEASVDHLRRRLLRYSKNAEGEDKFLASTIYRAFNDWVEEIAETGMVKGGSTEAAKLKSAITYTRETRQLFAPTDSMGKKTPGARILSKIMDDSAESPEAIIGLLFGQSGAKSKPAAGVQQALRHMMKIAKTGGDEQAANLGSGLRVAYWSSIIMDKTGKMLSPKMMKKNIDIAMNKQQSIFNTLYSKEEVGVMRRFSKALNDAVWEDPFPSKTAYGVQKFKKQKQGSSGVIGMGRNVTSANQKRAVFSKHNMLAARVWELIGQKLRDISGATAERGQLRAAKSTTAQTLTPKRSKTAPLITTPLSGVLNRQLNEDR